MSAIEAGARALSESRTMRFLVALVAAAGLTLVPMEAGTAVSADKHADGPGQTCDPGCLVEGFRAICCTDPIG